MEKPGARWGGSEGTRQLGLSGRYSTPPPTPTRTLMSHFPVHPDAPQHSHSLSPVNPLHPSPCQTPPQHPYLLPPSHSPSVPTSVPMASTTKSADLPTWPVSKPGPQARTFCAPASGLTWTSKGLGQRGSWYQCQEVHLPRAPLLSSLKSPCSPPLLSPMLVRQEGMGWGGTVLTCGGWHSHPK